MTTPAASRLPANWCNACTAPPPRPTRWTCRPVTIPIASSPPVLRPPILPLVWSRHNAHESFSGPPTFRGPQRLSLSPARCAGAGGRLGQRLSRCPARSAIISSLAPCLRLRSAALRPLARISAPASVGYHRVHSARLRSPSTRSGTQACAHNRESSSGCRALLVSFPLWPRHSRRPVSLPTHRHEAISARLWPAAPCRSPGPSFTSTPARECAAVGGACRQVLAQLSHFSRSCPGGPDVARWSAFLRGAGPSARGPPTG